MAKFTASVFIKSDSNLVKDTKKSTKEFKKFGREAKKNEKFLKRMSKASDVAGRSVTKFGRRGALALAAFSVAAFKVGSDASEIGSKYGVVFGAVRAESEETAAQFAKDFGLANTTAKKLLGDTGDLLSGFGFTDSAALGLSKRVNELAVDLASFSNIQGGARRASASLTKSLLGERESLKELGIAIREEDITKELKKRGLAGLEGRELRAAKALITLDLAFEQSAKAIGDYERTSESSANQIRLLVERIKEFSERFGNEVVSPLGEKVLPAINKFLGDEEKISSILTSIKTATEVSADFLKNMDSALRRVPENVKANKAAFQRTIGGSFSPEERTGNIIKDLFTFEGRRSAAAARKPAEVELRIHAQNPVSVEKVDEKTDVFIFPDIGVMTP